MTALACAAPSGKYVPFPTLPADPDTALAAAILAISTAFPEWTPDSSQLDYQLLAQVAAMSAQTAAVANQMAAAAFQFLTQDIGGILPILGRSASALTTWTMINDVGYTVPFGTIVAYLINGNTQVQFMTGQTITVSPGVTVATDIEIVAVIAGTAANAIPDTTPMVMVQQLAFVASVSATSTTSGGVDPETIAAYLDRASGQLEIGSNPVLCLPGDFAFAASRMIDGGNGQTAPYATRSIAINLLWPGRTITGTITLLTTTELQDTAGSFTPDDVGRTVTGTDIPSSTTISAYVSATQVTMNNAATGSETLGTVTLGDLTNAERAVTVACMDAGGNALTSTVAGELASFLETFREENFHVSVIGPTLNMISVTCTVYPLASYVGPPTLHDEVQAAITKYLSPAIWAGGDLVPPFWNPVELAVHYTAVIALISAVPGVAYCSALTLNGGTSDIPLTGNAPVPTPGTITVTVA